MKKLTKEKKGIKKRHATCYTREEAEPKEASEEKTNDRDVVI